jgi:autotransporter-associated beta strand protein
VTGLNNLSISGTTTLNTNTVTSIGTQTYGGALTLTQDTVLTGPTVATQASVISVGANANANANALTIDGNAVLGSSANDTVSGLSSLNVTGATRLAADVSTLAGQTYGGAVTLANDSTLTDFTNVRFMGAVDASTVAGASLSVKANGTVTFDGNVGAAKSLASLVIDASSVNTQSLAIRDQLRIAVSDVTTPSILNGAVSGLAMGLTKTGDGVLELAGTNAYTGDTRIVAGALVLTGAATLGQGNYTGAIQLSQGTRFEFDSSAAQILAGTVSGAGQVKQLGSGVLSLTGPNTYSGGTVFAGGVLEAASAGALSDTGDLAFSGGTLRYSANNQQDYSSRLSSTANAYRVDTAGQAVTFATALVGSTSSLNKLQTGNDSLNSSTDGNNLSPSSNALSVSGELKEAKNSRKSLIFKAVVESTGIKFPDNKVAGVTLRSYKMKLPPSVGLKKMKAIEQLLEELQVDGKPIATEAICDQFNDLRSDIVLLYELQQALNNCEFELQTILAFVVADGQLVNVHLLILGNMPAHSKP